MAFNRGGSSAGVAEGQFRIRADEVQQTRRIITNEAKAMGKAFKDAGQDAASGTREVNNSLKDTAKQAQETKRLLEGVFSVAFLQKGIAAAQNIKSLDTTFKILSGSQERANQNMETLEKLSARTGQPMIRLKEAANGVLTTVGRANIDLAQTVSLAQRLATLDPFQGFEGASFALREFLSGSPRSLAGRFELPLNQLKQITESAAGDPQKLIEGLDKLINEIGITEESLITMNEEGVTAFENAGAAAQEALGGAFQPIRNIAVAIAQAFTQLNSQNPGLTQTAFAVAGITAALVALRFAAAQAQTALKGLGGSSAIGRTLGLAGGVGFGIQAGLFATQQLAQRTNIQSGDLNRIRQGEDPSDILRERLSQAIVIFIDIIRQAAQSMVSIAGIVALGATFIGNGFGLVKAALQAGVGVLQDGFGRIQIAIGDLLVGLADALSGVTDTTGLRESGQGNRALGIANIELGSQNQREGAATLQRGIGITPEQANKIATNVEDLRSRIDNAFQGIERSAVSFLFPTLDQVAEKPPGIAAAFQPLVDAFKNAEPAFKELQSKTKELVDEFEAEAKRTAEARALVDSREAFDNSLQKARQARDSELALARSDTDFYRSRGKQIKSFYDGIQDLEDSAEYQRVQQLESFNRERLRRAEDFGDQLQKIEEDTRIGVAEAARRLDARAVFETQTRGKEQVDQLTSNFEKESARREEDFQLQQAQLVENLRKQRDQRVAAFNQQLADQLEEYNLSRARRLEDLKQQQEDAEFDRNLRLERLQEDRIIEDRIRQENLNKKITDLNNAFLKENNFSKAFATVFSSLMGGIRDNTVQTFSSILTYTGQVAARVKQILGGQQTTSSTNTSPSGGIRPFATGGIPPINQGVLINDRTESALLGGQLAIFSKPATIFSASQTRQLLGGAGGPSIQIGTFSPVFGDIGDRTDEQVIALINRSFQELFGRGQNG